VGDNGEYRDVAILKFAALLIVFPLLAALPAARAAELPMAAEPLVHERAGAIQGCGARLTGGQAGTAGTSAWFDVSFNVFRGGVALAQSFAYELRGSQYDGDARPARVPLQSAWLKAPRAAARFGENRQRSDTLVYPLVLDDAFALFQALAAGDTLTVGIKRWDQRAATVYAGKPALSEEDQRRLADCLVRLTD
jgi:hypothetical protein